MTTRLGILCGGRSGEHEVSLQSAQSIFAAAERPRFEPMLVAIDKDGQWRLGTVEELLRQRDTPARIHLNPEAPRVQPVAGDGRCLLADPSTPAPTKGTFNMRSIPCKVPSSPSVP